MRVISPLLAAGVIAAASLTAGGAAAAAGTQSAPAVAPDDWPMFHQNIVHDGVSTDTLINTTTAPTLTKAWSALVGTKAGPVYPSPAAVYNPTLGETVVYDAGTNGYVDAFNAANGHVIWQVSVGAGVEASPAVYGGTVYIANLAGTLTALNVLTGATQCSVTLPVTAPEKTPPKILSSPAVANVDGDGPVVFFGDVGTGPPTEFGHEWAVTGYGNSEGNCKIEWSFDAWNNPGNEQTGSWSPPALAKTSTGEWLDVFGSANPDDSVYALDATTGALVWRFQTEPAPPGNDNDVGAGPTISAPGVNGFADGVVYVDGKNYIEYALNLATGAQIWSFNMHTDTGVTTPTEESTACLLGNDLILDFDYYLYEFNATTGKVIWRVATPDSAQIIASPAVSGAAGQRVVFIGDIDGHEYGLQQTNGDLLFTYSGTSPIWSSTAISDGMLFFGDNGGDVTAFAPSGS